jgi:hypothetical protein
MGFKMVLSVGIRLTAEILRDCSQMYQQSSCDHQRIAGRKEIDPMSYLLYCYAHAKLTSVSLNHRLSLGPFRSHRTLYLKIGGNKLHQTIQNAI